MPGKSGWRVRLAHPGVKGGKSRAKDWEPWRQGKWVGALRAGGWGGVGMMAGGGTGTDLPRSTHHPQYGSL